MSSDLQTLETMLSKRAAQKLEKDIKAAVEAFYERLPEARELAVNASKIFESNTILSMDSFFYRLSEHLKGLMRSKREKKERESFLAQVDTLQQQVHDLRSDLENREG